MTEREELDDEVKRCHILLRQLYRAYPPGTADDWDAIQLDLATLLLRDVKQVRDSNDPEQIWKVREQLRGLYLYARDELRWRRKWRAIMEIIKKLDAEIKRNEELLQAYQEIPTGFWGATFIQRSLEAARQAKESGELAEMELALKSSQENE